MSEPIPDLWPEDIAEVKVRAPTAILAEQANQLGSRTKNIVTAEITPLRTRDPSRLAIAFSLFAPALNYKLRLLNVSHGHTALYPARVTDHLNAQAPDD